MGVMARGKSWVVRVYDPEVGKAVWVGTFATREAAEAAERKAKPPKRQCRECGKNFRPTDDRRATCDPCVEEKRRAEPPIDDHWLYRCYDSDLKLLYVGITSVGTKRFRRHGNHKEWWCEVDTIKIDHFESRPEVEAAERRAIWDLKPKYNSSNARRDMNVVRMADWRRRTAS